MTDTQLEELARDVTSKIFDPRWPETARYVILAALKSVQQANSGSPAIQSVEPAEDTNRDCDLPQVGGEMMDRSIADHQRACRVLINDEQRKIAPDNHLIATLCDSVRMGREYVRHMRDTVRAALPICDTPTEGEAGEGLPVSQGTQ